MRTLNQQLRRDHEQLESLLKGLSEDEESSDAACLQKSWAQFERRLVRHLRDEEQHLLPRFLASHPEEVRSILTEHQRIRELVSELGVEIDLHTIRKVALDRLIRMLQVHAKAEERGLYRWVEQQASPIAHK